MASFFERVIFDVLSQVIDDIEAGSRIPSPKSRAFHNLSMNRKIAFEIVYMQQWVTEASRGDTLAVPKRSASMATQSLRSLLADALEALKPEYPRMPFDVQTIRQKMELLKGEALSDEDSNQIPSLMTKFWGAGVEPAALGNQLWRFGYGRPPVSREIGGPY